MKRQRQRQRVARRVPWLVTVVLTATMNTSKSLVSAAASLPFPYRSKCPTDSSIDGYTSLSDLNLEMKYHASLLASPSSSLSLSEQQQQQQQQQPQHEDHHYIYTLCPNTKYNGSQQLTPLLDRTFVRCGNKNQGSAHDNCVIDGGLVQVLLIDSGDYSTTASTASTASTKLFTFQGITFTNSQDMSIAALASTTTRAEFLDCHWKNAHGSAAIFMAKGHPVTLPWQNPDVTFRFDNVFDNLHRRLLLLDVDMAMENDRDTPNKNALWADPFTTYQQERRTAETTSTSTSTSAGMTVLLRGCSITNSGHAALSTSSSTAGTTTTNANAAVETNSNTPFRAIFNNEGSLEVYDAVFFNNTGLFVVNTFAGGYFFASNVQFRSNRVTAAIVRGTNRALVDLQHVTFANNTKSLATVAVLEDSKLVLESTFFSKNVPILADLVVFARARAVVYDSCWDAHGIVVDSTSELEQDNNYISMPASPHCPLGDGQILHMQSDWQCYNDRKICPGTCVQMKAPQCPLTVAVAADHESSSTNTHQWGAAGLLALVWLFLGEGLPFL